MPQVRSTGLSLSTFLPSTRHEAPRPRTTHGVCLECKFSKLHYVFFVASQEDVLAYTETGNGHFYINPQTTTIKPYGNDTYTSKYCSLGTLQPDNNLIDAATCFFIAEPHHSLRRFALAYRSIAQLE